MGPFPHDAPPPRISGKNPAGTDGFEFVEFAHPEPEKLGRLPLWVSATRVNCGTARISPRVCSSDRFILPAASGKMR